VKSKLKRKKIELELAEFDLEDIEFIAQNCLNEFNKVFIHESKIRENEEAQKKEEEQKNEIEKQNNESREKSKEIKQSAKKSASKEAKSLFKKIATETHPDKLTNSSDEEKELKSKYFLKAQKAIEENDLASLLDVANKLNLSSGLVAEEETKIIQTKIDFIRSKIHEMKQTAAWIWHHSKGEQKENIEKQLTGQMGFKRIDC
tara:strand:- start:1312 stop:1920 length:609 start_codon:yes stop_codon:yes gene_type:complete